MDFGHYERGKGISCARELQWQLFYKLVKDFLPFWGCIQKMRFNQCGIVLGGTLVESVLFDDTDRLLKQNLFVQKVTYIFRSLAGGKTVMEFEFLNFKVEWRNLSFCVDTMLYILSFRVENEKNNVSFRDKCGDMNLSFCDWCGILRT